MGLLPMTSSSSSQASSKNTTGQSKQQPSFLKSPINTCTLCCTSTLNSIKSLCCPTYKRYEDDESAAAVTPVRVKAPVFNTLPTITVQPQVIGKVDSYPYDKRSKAAAAAERREEQQRNRGIGNSDRAEGLEEAHRKDELIGRITELYATNQEEPPIGLRLMTVRIYPAAQGIVRQVQQLRDHHRVLKERSNTVQPSPI